MNPPLLIYTVASGRYRVYTGLFEYCISKAYPDYKIMVHYVEDEMNIKYFGACMRFLFDPGWNDGDVYITDIDMLICLEVPELQKFHRKEIDESGNCFSNRPRWKEPHGENRLTGLHYVTKEWWAKTKQQRFLEWEKLSKGEIGNGKCDDELMLMRIARNSGLTIPEHGSLIDRHHGIHLGTVRDYRNETVQKRKTALQQRISRERARYWIGIVDSKEYKDIVSSINDRQALWELNELEKFCRSREK